MSGRNRVASSIPACPVSGVVAPTTPGATCSSTCNGNAPALVPVLPACARAIRQTALCLQL
jgi:hypothetical protein